MGQVNVTLNGRTYRLACEDGQEARFHQLAQDLTNRVDKLVAEFGPGAHERLLVMAALMLTDELFEALERVTAPADAGNA